MKTSRVPIMALHQTSGRWQFGLLLALITTFCWATLSVALKISLEQIDAITLTWFRFLTATFVVFIWLSFRGGLKAFANLRGRDWAWLFAAGLLLIGNYVFYLFGVDQSTPANAQLLIQLAPLLMALGGIFIYREPYRIGQWCGMLLIVGGLVLFFSNQLTETRVSRSDYLIGSAWVIVAAVVWAGYALIQKQLLLQLSSPAILLFIYALASVILLPFSDPSALLKLDQTHWIALLYCAANTLIAYGCFAEALAHWEASRVSAILATTPLLCLGAVAATHAIAPSLIQAENVTLWGYVGAVVVMAGSSMSSLLGQKK
jgi:drug/metabolite transporter (DMT)-like permease